MENLHLVCKILVDRDLLETKRENARLRKDLTDLVGNGSPVYFESRLDENEWLCGVCDKLWAAVHDASEGTITRYRWYGCAPLHEFERIKHSLDAIIDKDPYLSKCDLNAFAIVHAAYLVADHVAAAIHAAGVQCYAVEELANHIGPRFWETCWEEISVLVNTRATDASPSPQS